MRALKRLELTVALAVVVCNCAVSIAADGRYSMVIDAIEAGDRETAAGMLERILRDDFIDADGFYCYSMLERKGELSVEFLQKGLRLCEKSCGSILSRLAEAYYVWGRYQDVAELYAEQRNDVEKTPENMKFFWFAGMSFIRLGEYSSAAKAFRDIEKEHAPARLSGWGTLGGASVLAERGKVRDAVSSLKPLVASGGEISTLAIYNRAYLATQMKDQDDALFGYDVLSQQFGDFLGSAQLGEMIRTGKSGQSPVAPERTVDITYAVEMGVFNNKSDADKLEGKLRAANWPVEVQDTIAEDRRCWMVRVGVFRSEESAQQTKKQLESLYPGSYRVVIR